MKSRYAQYAFNLLASFFSLYGLTYVIWYSSPTLQFFQIFAASASRLDKSKDEGSNVKKSNKTASGETKRVKSRIKIREKKKSKGIEGTFSEIKLHEDENKTERKLSNVLDKQSGIHINRLGGSGAYSSLSLRGSDPRQTAVYLDGILLNSPLAGGADLESLPLELFKVIELYSEHTPLHLAGMSLGGSINLVPKDTYQEEISFFGEAHADTSFGGGGGIGIAKARDFHYFSFEASQNRYFYLDNRGTPLLNQEDDQIRIRENEDFWAISHTSFIRSGIDANHKNFKVFLDYYAKKRGLPGNIRALLREVRLETHRLSVKLTHELAPLHWFSMASHLSAHGSYSSLEDPSKELSFNLSNRKNIYYNIEAALNPSFYFLKDSLNLYLLLGGRFYQAYGGQSHFQHLANRYEINTGIGLEYRPEDLPVLIVNSFKGNWLQDAPYSGLEQILPVSQDMATGLSQERFLLAYSLLIQISLIKLYDKIFESRFSLQKRWLTLYFQSTPLGRRAPHIYEAYGDGALILPNPSLKEENSSAFSVGVESGFEIGQVNLSFKTGYFRNQFDQLIILLMKSEKTFRSENIGAALNQGVESELKIVWQEYLLFLSRFSFLSAVDRGEISFYSGKNLPFLPQYKTFLYLEGGLVWIKLFTELLYRAEVYRDRFNTQENFLPSNIRLAAGLIYYFLEKQYSLYFSVQNILNQKNHHDLIGYPLPGIIFKIQINRRLI